MSNPPSLDQLRIAIDAVDEKLLALLDERAALSLDIARAKAQEPQTKGLVRPDREALLLRKLIARPRRALSNAAVIALWREIISESVRLQGQTLGRVTVGISAREPETELNVWIRNRFGHAVTTATYADEKALLEASAQNPNLLAALSLDPKSGAWWARLLGLQGLSVVAALPENEHRPKALVVAAQSPEPSGSDLSFWVTDSDKRPDALVRDLGVNGFGADFLYEAQGFKLFSLMGFVQAEDQRLMRLPGDLKGVIGSAPL